MAEKGQKEKNPEAKKDDEKKLGNAACQ